MKDRFRFRAFLKEKKELLKVQYINPETGYVMCNRESGTQEFASFDNVEIMQCTGIKDKTGKLIYEGDIVRTWKFSTGITKLSVIVWNEARCGFRLYDKDKYLRNIHNSPQSMVNVTTIEVLGNIYENPELLEG